MATSAAESSSESSQVDYDEHHASLHRSTAYVAHKLFLGSTTWGITVERQTKTLCVCDTLSSRYCVITGTISKHNFHMSMVGDFQLIGEPPQPYVPLLDSYLRFSLEEPTDPAQAPFVQDFRKFVEVTHDLVDAIPGGGKKGSVYPFLSRSEGGQWRFNFEFGIFGMKDIRSIHDEDDPLELDTYPIPEKYQPFTAGIGYPYFPRRLPLWDYTGDAVDAQDHEEWMKDALVEVRFQLKHDRTWGLNAEISRVSIIGPYED